VHEHREALHRLEGGDGREERELDHVLRLVLELAGEGGRLAGRLAVPQRDHEDHRHAQRRLAHALKRVLLRVEHGHKRVRVLEEAVEEVPCLVLGDEALRDGVVGVREQVAALADRLLPLVALALARRGVALALARGRRDRPAVAQDVRVLLLLREVAEGLALRRGLEHVVVAQRGRGARARRPPLVAHRRLRGVRVRRGVVRVVRVVRVWLVGRALHVRRGMHVWWGVVRRDLLERVAAERGRPARVGPRRHGCLLLVRLGAHRMPVAIWSACPRGDSLGATGDTPAALPGVGGTRRESTSVIWSSFL
jgi:hypothetical protein